MNLNVSIIPLDIYPVLAIIPEPHERKDKIIAAPSYRLIVLGGGQGGRVSVRGMPIKSLKGDTKVVI